jgi:ribosomal protein S18 acetylase RimI-like enzyme
MENYQFTTGLSYALEQLNEMHNLSFSGYLLPMETTPVELATFYRAHQLDLAWTILMHTEAGEFVGFCCVGIRNTRSWCGNLGIAPKFRGRGLGKILLNQVITLTREAGLKTLQLETITKNEPAFKLYKGAGFSTLRTLHSLRLATADLREQQTNITFAPLTSELPFACLQNQVRPCWQREPASILSTAHEVLASTSLPDSIALCYQRTSNLMRVQSVILSPATEKEALAALLVAAAGEIPQILIPSEPENSQVLLLARELGGRETLRFYEMELALDKDQ